jgi:dolichol-phosphate mannosyltransferase
MSASAPSLSLVIPTRNEAENVGALLEGIRTAIPGRDKELIFVDDSVDETPLLLQRLLANVDCQASVVHRPRFERSGGLSTAVVRGCGFAEGTWICIMDADLQHPASAVPMLLETAAATGADIVVGSRHTANQDAPDGFDGPSRRLISNSARVLARTLIPSARATTDPMSGFFLFRRSVIAGVDLRPIGYKVLLEILVRGHWRTVVDVPYVFHSRNAGVSKATLRQGIQFIRHLRRLAMASEPRKRNAAVQPEAGPIPPQYWRHAPSDDALEPSAEPTGAVHAER